MDAKLDNADTRAEKSKWVKDLMIGIERLWLEALRKTSEYQTKAKDAYFPHCTSARDALYRIKMHRNNVNVAQCLLLICFFTTLACTLSIHHLLHSAPKESIVLDLWHVTFYGVIFVISSLLLWNNFRLGTQYGPDELVWFIAHQWEKDCLKLPSETLLDTLFTQLGTSNLTHDLKFNTSGSHAVKQMKGLVFGIAVETMAQKIPLESDQNEQTLRQILEKSIGECVYLLHLLDSKTPEEVYRKDVYSRACSRLQEEQTS